jgi:glycogen operon protein
VRDPQMKDISWLNPDGTEMSDEDWGKRFARSVGVLISGHGLTERDELARMVEDDDVLLLLNAHDETIEFKLPGREEERWDAVLDTSAESADSESVDGKPYAPGTTYSLQSRSLALLVKPNRRDPARTDA